MRGGGWDGGALVWSPDSYKNNFGDRQKKKGVQTCHGGFHADTHACKKNCTLADSGATWGPMGGGVERGGGWLTAEKQWCNADNSITFGKEHPCLQTNADHFPTTDRYDRGSIPTPPLPLPPSHPIRHADVINQGTLSGWHRGSTTTPRPARVGTCLRVCSDWDFCRITAAKGVKRVHVCTAPAVQMHCCVSPEHSTAAPSHSSPSSSSTVRPMVPRGLLLQCRTRPEPKRPPPASVFSVDTPRSQPRDPSCGQALCSEQQNRRKERQAGCNLSQHFRSVSPPFLFFFKFRIIKAMINANKFQGLLRPCFKSLNYFIYFFILQWIFK